jgi:hypothetical protein
MSRLECSVRPCRILADNSFSKVNSPNLAWSDFKSTVPLAGAGFPAEQMEHAPLGSCFQEDRQIGGDLPLASHER